MEEGETIFGAVYGKPYSDKTAELIDTEIKNIMDQAYIEVKELLAQHRQAVDNLKDALLKYETLDGEEVKLIIAGGKLDKPTVGDLLEAEKKNLTAAPAWKKQPEDQRIDTPADPFPKPDPGMTK